MQSALDAIDAAVSHRIARRPNLSRAAPDEELAATIPAAMSLSAAALVEQPPKGTGAGRLALLVLTTVLCCAGVGFSYLGQLERMVSMLCDLIRV